MFIYSDRLKIVSSWAMSIRLWILNKSEQSFKIEIKYIAKLIWHLIICVIVIICIIIRCIYMQYISMAKVSTFYYNQTFWSFGNICSGKKEEKGALVVQKLTPLYIHASSSLLLSPLIHHSFLKGIAKKEKFFNCRLISNHASTPVNWEWLPALVSWWEF